VLFCERQEKLLKRLQLRFVGVKTSEFLGVPTQHFVALCR
jgi:hypothetical protein